MNDMYAAKSGWYEVDGRRVHLDSGSEYKFITTLVNNGFSGKWSRPPGVRFGIRNYKADFTLDIIWNSVATKAFVEYKSKSATEFSLHDRSRALAALHYYSSHPLLLLYVGKTRQWSYIDPKTKRAIHCDSPVPSVQPIPTKTVASIPYTNPYGRRYASKMLITVLGGFANALEWIIREIFWKKKKRRRRRK